MIYTKQDLDDILAKIQPSDKAYKKAAQRRFDNIAKPIQGLGKLEEIISDIAAVQKSVSVDIRKKALVIMCADNGIVEEGVSQAGQDITAIVARNFVKGITTVNLFSEYAGVSVFPVDIGIAADMKDSGIIDRKIAYGTKNFLKEDAMCMEECIGAIMHGVDMVKDLKKESFALIATGEMGIGNTTTSAALASVLCNLSVEVATGKGAGLSDDLWKHKQEVIREAIQNRGPAAGRGKKDVLETLAKLGGLDIAGLVGVFIGGAMYHIPVVIDGLISLVAAYIAYLLHSDIRDYMISSHISKEPAVRYILEDMGLSPILDAGLCLGEGTGAILLLPMLDMAYKVYAANSTFEDIHMDAYERFDV